MTRPPVNETLISVVLPIYNEADVIEQLHGRVHRAVIACGMGQEIIFVNDGSTDGSGQILDSLAERYRHVRVIHLARNFGHQAAIHAGLCNARGDAVVLMDSDLQDCPEAIGRLVAEWITGYDVVYALRCDRPEAAWKRCLFSVFHRLLSSVASTDIPADAGNFSIIDARVVREIVALGECDRYLPGLRSWVGFKQRGIEIRRDRRYDDRPRVALRGLWRLAKTAIFSFSSFPLTVFYVIGYSALALFLLLGGYALFCKAFTSLSVPGWTSNVLVASFFGAVNSLGICILGEYVIRIYDQVRGRPLYVVNQTRNVHPAADNHWPDNESHTWPGADRRTASERRAAAERRDSERRAFGDRRAVAQLLQDGADLGSAEYLTFAAEFDTHDDLGGDWRTDLESDADYDELIAEAESLMALVLPATASAKLHQPQPTDQAETSAPPSSDPLNQDPLNADSLDIDQMWLVGEQSPADAKRAADKRLPAEHPVDKRSPDHKQSAGRGRPSSTERGHSPSGESAPGKQPAADHREKPDAGRAPKAEKTGRRGRKGKDRRGE